MLLPSENKQKKTKRLQKDGTIYTAGLCKMSFKSQVFLFLCFIVKTVQMTYKNKRISEGACITSPYKRGSAE